MGTSPIALIFLVAVGFMFGTIAGYFAYKSEVRKAQQKQADAPVRADPRQKLLVEQVSLWRERAGGRLVVWMDDKPLNSPQALEDSRRRQLAAAGQEFLAWLNPQPAAAETPPRPAAAIPAPRPPVPAAPSAAPAVAATVLPEGADSAAPAKAMTIVQQIDEILQEKVKNDPALAERGIRLVEDPRQGVVVWVGLEHFGGVDSVPYPEVKAVLRQAAAEWERRTERVRR